MIIDSHTHIFPEKIAQKAVDGICSFYDLKMDFDGTLGMLLDVEKRAGVDKCLVQSVATSPTQVQSINNFIAQSVKMYPKKLIGFGAIHPDFEDIEGEIDRIISLGLKGIKLHPDFQNFRIDDEKAMRIYEYAQGRLPILVHTGDSRYDRSKPARMARVLDEFPKLDVIAAHFGGWSEWADVEQAYKGRRVYVDTSSSMYALSVEKVKELIEFFGSDYVMFGTDYPMWDAKDELEMLKKIPLTDDEREKILHKNLERLISI